MAKRKRNNSVLPSSPIEGSYLTKDEENPTVPLQNHFGSDKKTLVSTLSQAVHLNDTSMLEMAFSEGLKDPSLIEITVRRLPQALAIPFFKKLGLCIVESPNRLMVYLPWVSALISAHCSIILSTPLLHEQLRSLLETLESRLSSRSELERLSGKLNFLVDRIGMRLEGGLTPQEKEFVPAQVFSERIEDEATEQADLDTEDTEDADSVDGSDRDASDGHSDEGESATTIEEDSDQESEEEQSDASIGEDCSDNASSADD
ncbi:Small subunit (SSU) processome component [Mitosporidium daphniae]|uniref:U3 snoRNP-associated protein Utp5 n=1 Tax=Mitosporidium daphniae TaxID=1485682 RepID=A0A098VUN1_9MICR|nr:U3 snoRNP-associated protein Utp5 [Mitosporidium daphniae]KGG52569.1 U3 snoRNP-associated protein Utp5 [Mitosporidium daphniae]|eukprot:XP_013238996.1 U3 snoRNP-associated protein Utp5 [Mitosporidium daphniae]